MICNWLATNQTWEAVNCMEHDCYRPGKLLTALGSVHFRIHRSFDATFDFSFRLAAEKSLTYANRTADSHTVHHEVSAPTDQCLS
jgi:hypothetical protein